MISNRFININFQHVRVLNYISLKAATIAASAAWNHCWMLDGDLVFKAIFIQAATECSFSVKHDFIVMQQQFSNSSSNV